MHITDSNVVLIATDFSPLSQRAADRAADLANRLGAELRFVHVVEPIEDPDTADPETRAFHEELLEKARAHLQAELERVSATRAEAVALLGPRALTLLNLSQQVQPVMLVMGSSMREYPSNHQAGISLQVLVQANVPVLCVPAVESLVETRATVLG